MSFYLLMCKLKLHPSSREAADECSSAYTVSVENELSLIAYSASEDFEAMQEKRLDLSAGFRSVNAGR